MSRDELRAAASGEFDRWEAAIADELVRLFDRQQAMVLARLTGAKARKNTRHWQPQVGVPAVVERKIDPRYVSDPARWVRDAATALSPLMGRLYAAVFGRVAKQLDGPPLADDDARVADAIAVRLERVGQGVETALGEVAAHIEARDDAGDDMPAIAASVRELYQARKPTWAARISTLSAVGSVNHAALLAAMDAGSSAKQWISSRDALVRDTHVKADGQVRLLDERFRLGGIPTHPRRSLLAFPGDPSPGIPLDEVINCRCSLVFSPPRTSKSGAPDLEVDAGAPTGVEEKALPANQGCKYCAAPATKRLIHAEGRAYVPVCDAHVAKGTDAVGGPNEVDFVRDVKADAETKGDSHTPPDSVRSAARRGLELRREHGRGGTEVGVARARDLANGSVSTDTVRRMASYFARHEVDKSGAGWGSSSDPSAGYVAWLLWGGDAGASWARGVLRSADAKDAGLDLEGKARVRTAAGARQYGQPIGSVIVPDAPGAGRRVGDVAGLAVDDASDDPAVRAMVARYAPAGGVPDPATTRVLAARDQRGRVGGFVVWQHADGARPAGTVLDVSVHPKLRGRRIGDGLVALAAGEDPAVRPTTRTPRASASTAPAPAARAPRPVAGAIADRRRAGDVAGTSGDFDADAARIGRLQKAYLDDRVDTTHLHSRGGKWTAERDRAHKAIVEHFLGRPGVKADGRLLVLGGLPGAGKTTTINSADGQRELGIDLAHYVTVNADEVKEQMLARGMVPDYPGLGPEEAATLYHAESFEVAHMVMRAAARRGLNFVYDTSLKTTGQMGFATSAARSSPHRYDTTVVFVDVPVPVARQRARDRYLGGDRYMPLHLIDGMRARGSRRSSLPAENFDAVKRGADRWFAFDNAGATPTLTGRSR